MKDEGAWSNLFVFQYQYIVYATVRRRTVCSGYWFTRRFHRDYYSWLPHTTESGLLTKTKGVRLCVYDGT